MKFEIKNRWGGELLFSSETDTWRLAIEAAIKAKADLRYADLSSADLSYADLRSALGFTAYQATPLKMLEFQTGPIRLFKLVNAKGIGPFNGGITYEVGEGYECPEANCNEQEQCAAGLNVATLDWCLLHLEQGYRIFVVEFQAKDIAAIPIATDGKIRVKKLKVVEELDLSKYLPKKEEKAVSA